MITKDKTSDVLLISLVLILIINGLTLNFTEATSLAPNRVYAQVHDPSPVLISSPTNITQPGYYELAANLNGTQSAGYCIGIFASNVVLNGNGHWLNGTGSGAGIYVSASASNVTIESIKIVQYNYGINIGGSYITVANSTITSNSYGIYIGWGSYNTVTNSIIANNSDGIDIEYGSNITVANSTITSNSYGIDIGGSYITVANSTITSNYIYGIYIYSDSDYNTVTNSIIANNSDGIDIGGSYITVANSIITSNNYGINIGGSNNTV
ncbi:MAG: right-handed parallel beta-helix repeat-containing protein, partial [Nitrososphaeria archaeon]